MTLAALFPTPLISSASSAHLLLGASFLPSPPSPSTLVPGSLAFESVPTAGRHRSSSDTHLIFAPQRIPCPWLYLTPADPFLIAGPHLTSLPHPRPSHVTSSPVPCLMFTASPLPPWVHLSPPHCPFPHSHISVPTIPVPTLPRVLLLSHPGSAPDHSCLTMDALWFPFPQLQVSAAKTSRWTQHHPSLITWR